MPRSQPPAPTTSDESFDYVIAGGGSAACTLAAELSADPAVRVLVLEAGDRAEDHPETLRADGYKTAFANDALMIERFSEPQRACRDRVLYMGSGRGAGGSGSVNGLVYTRGSAGDYDTWGLDGWRWRDVVPDFERLEAALRPHRREPTRFTEACIAAAEAAGFRRKEDLNDGEICGTLGYEWMNYEGDDRRSSYAALLRPALARPNVVLRTGARVESVAFDGERRATGVWYRHGGTRRFAPAAGEVVLSAGALESPKLLMLSGVGPGAQLQGHGLQVVCDLPVGANLHDHPNVTAFFRGQPTDCFWAQLYGFHRANPGTDLQAGEADTCYVFYSARSSLREAAIRMAPTLMPQTLYRVPGVAKLTRLLLAAVLSTPVATWVINRLFGIVVILGKPKSRGTLRLRSPHPEDTPRVDPGYFSHPDDLETMVRGVQLALRISTREPLQRWGTRPISLAPDAGRDAIERFIIGNVMTTYHYAGTCSMAAGDAGVVDTSLRVRGVHGLRVADASVVPFTPVSAMNAPSMLVGLRAARLLRGGPLALSGAAERPALPAPV